MKKQVTTISYFVCPECGLEMPLSRVKCLRREKGHIKDLYCPTCKKVQKFKEIRNIDFYKNLDGETLEKDSKEEEAKEKEKEKQKKKQKHETKKFRKIRHIDSTWEEIYERIRRL